METTPTPAEAATAAAGDGWGTLEVTWVTHHVPDTRFDAGAAYDPDPSVVPPGGDPKFNATYYAVTVMRQRMLMYSMRFPRGTGISAAKARVMREFPADARVDWAATKDSCHMIQVTSPSLRRAGVTRDSALVSFTSGGEYTARDVHEATLLESEPVSGPDEAMGC